MSKNQYDPRDRCFQVSQGSVLGLRKITLAVRAVIELADGPRFESVALMCLDLLTTTLHTVQWCRGEWPISSFIQMNVSSSFPNSLCRLPLKKQVKSAHWN